jgi:hypothetical protein
MLRALGIICSLAIQLFGVEQQSETDAKAISFQSAFCECCRRRAHPAELCGVPA